MPFELQRKQGLPHKGFDYEEYLDTRTGAKHIHLFAPDSPEKAFMVSFPTLPSNDDGRAHVLEHVALCGSEKFPVRDPFFAMTRRSLSSFMNAMTYPDRTVYPFATQDWADFNNLMDVYLDAAFFPKIERHDFLQEGWRHELNAKGELEYHGVVFNEMKGALASPVGIVYHRLFQELLPNTPHAVESGGDPLVIPSLTHEGLLEFHRQFYHASRAVFYTYGAFEASVVQEKFEQQVLSRATQRLDRVQPGAAVPPLAPRTTTLIKPSQGSEAEEGLEIAWLLEDKVAEHDKILEWHLFASVAMGDSASPVVQAMETAGFGRPSELTHLSTAGRQAVLVIGMDGLEAHQRAQARAVIFGALETLATQGVDPERLESALRQFEMQSRESAGGRMPDGMSQLLAMPSLEIHGGDPLKAIDDDEDLNLLREKIKNPQFVQELARKLIEWPARLEAAIQTDPEYFAKREALEAEQLRETFSKLTAQDKARIEQEAADLREKQRAVPDAGLLPKIEPKAIARVPAPTLPVQWSVPEQGPAQAFVSAKTNGIGYLGVDFDASSVAQPQWPWLAVCAAWMMDLGMGELDYVQAQVARSKYSPGVGSVFRAHEAAAHGQSEMALRFGVSAKGLERDAHSIAEVLGQSLCAPRFDEHERIAFLVQSAWQDAQQSLSDDAPQLAALESRASLTLAGRLAALLEGPQSLVFLQQLDAWTRTPEGLQRIEDGMRSAHQTLAQLPAVITWVGSQEAAQQAFAVLSAQLASNPALPAASAIEQPLKAIDPVVNRMVGLEGPGQVNFCHAAWIAPKRAQPGSAQLHVLAAYLRNAFLHRALREEGGAYGSGAHYLPDQGVFAMSSYRDPRLSGTYADFDRAIAFVANEPVAPQALEEAIVSVMQTMDKLQSPKQQAAISLALAARGADESVRERERLEVLLCTGEQLQAWARSILVGKPRNEVAYVCAASREEAQRRGLALRPAASVGEEAPAIH